MLDKDVVMVLMLEDRAVPELEEQFGHGTCLDWNFSSLPRFEADPAMLDPEVVNRWLTRAAAPGAEPITLSDPVLSTLLAESKDFGQFALRAAAAIESAADRGVSSLDDASLEDAREARLVEANHE